MSSKIVTIVGATGAQGGSIINALLKDPSYKIRGLTRNPQGEAGKALAARGVEVVKADINDPASLTAAFAGSYAVYAITDFFEPFAKYGPTKAIEIESTQGINLAKAAAATSTLQHYIWSTLPNGKATSNGRWVIPHFEAKNKVDAYIRTQPALLAKTTFFWVTFYAQNYAFPMFTPIHVPSAGKYIQLNVTPPNVPIKTIGDVRTNIGLFVKSVLDQPSLTLGGKIVLADVEDTTIGDMLQMWARIKGTKAESVQVTVDEYDAVWPAWGKEMGDMMKLWEEVGERSWAAESGLKLLTKDDLGVKGLLGLEKSLQAIEG
jgi:NmrA-like family